MLDLQTISDRIEIDDLITTYTRAVDTLDWDRPIGSAGIAIIRIAADAAVIRRIFVEPVAVERDAKTRPVGNGDRTVAIGELAGEYLFATGGVVQNIEIAELRTRDGHVEHAGFSARREQIARWKDIAAAANIKAD